MPNDNTLPVAPGYDGPNTLPVGLNFPAGYDNPTYGGGAGLGLGAAMDFIGRGVANAFTQSPAEITPARTPAAKQSQSQPTASPTDVAAAPPADQSAVGKKTQAGQSVPAGALSSTPALPASMETLTNGLTTPIATTHSENLTSPATHSLEQVVASNQHITPRMLQMLMPAITQANAPINKTMNDMYLAAGKLRDQDLALAAAQSDKAKRDALSQAAISHYYDRLSGAHNSQVGSYQYLLGQNRGVGPGMVDPNR